MTLSDHIAAGGDERGLDPLDYCECGDYRRDHKDGTGLCCFNGPSFDLNHGGKDCHQFRLAALAKMEEQKP